MAHYRAAIDIRQPRADVFAHPSDFSTSREWDPGVVEAERLNGQAVGEGTEVGKVVDNLGLAGTDTIAVLIVERSGRIRARETGGFEEPKADRRAAALAAESSSRVRAA